MSPSVNTPCCGEGKLFTRVSQSPGLASKKRKTAIFFFITKSQIVPRDNNTFRLFAMHLMKMHLNHLLSLRPIISKSIHVENPDIKQLPRLSRIAFVKQGMSPSIQVSLGVSLEIVLRCLHAMRGTRVVHLICSRGNWHCCWASFTPFFSLHRYSH